MKKLKFLFLCTALLGLLIAPAVNVFAALQQGSAVQFDKKSLYNLDFAASLLNRVLYGAGISQTPTKALIGYDGWLYLTSTTKRGHTTAKDQQLNREIGSAMQAWNGWLQGQGVLGFWVMVGPDKGTIYPEFLPMWARAATPSKTDDLLSQVSSARYIDLRKPLLDAKETSAEPLYFRTDTHWNALGGGVAFESFAQRVSAEQPSLLWPRPDSYELTKVHPKTGGDLAKFLRIEEYLADTRLSINGARLKTKTRRYNYDSSQLVFEGGNTKVRVNKEPIRVQSSNALNNAKVLWLRDSFGNVMSPLMTATFSDVVHLHHSQAFGPDGRIAELVKKFKPDYVVVTVVERDARLSRFASLPPS